MSPTLYCSPDNLQVGYLTVYKNNLCEVLPPVRPGAKLQLNPLKIKIGHICGMFWARCVEEKFPTRLKSYVVLGNHIVLGSKEYEYRKATLEIDIPGNGFITRTANYTVSVEPTSSSSLTSEQREGFLKAVESFTKKFDKEQAEKRALSQKDWEEEALSSRVIQFFRVTPTRNHNKLWSSNWVGFIDRFLRNQVSNSGIAPGVPSPEFYRKMRDKLWQVALEVREENYTRRCLGAMKGKVGQ